MQFLDAIKCRVKSDGQLSAMLSMASEYAEIYLLAKQRQKGCDGMGELTTMKEEFRDVVDKVIQEKDLYDFIQGHIDKPVEFLKKESEKIVRSYDPCISCSVHVVVLEETRKEGRGLG